MGLNSNRLLVVQTLLIGQTHLTMSALNTSPTAGAPVAQSQTTIMQAMVQKRTAALAANQAQQIQAQATAALRRAQIRFGRQYRLIILGHVAPRSHGCRPTNQG